MDKTYIISHDLLQETVNFLSTRPYGDVFKLISKLWALQPIPKPEVEPKDPSSD